MASRDEPRWEEPPAVQGRGRTGVWVRRLAPLMEHPGRWANLGEANPNIGTALKRNHVKRPPGEWEFKFRKKNAEGLEASKGRGFFYARYLGPSEADTDDDHSPQEEEC